MTSFNQGANITQGGSRRSKRVNNVASPAPRVRRTRAATSPILTLDNSDDQNDDLLAIEAASNGNTPILSSYSINMNRIDETKSGESLGNPTLMPNEELKHIIDSITAFLEPISEDFPPTLWLHRFTRRCINCLGVNLSSHRVFLLREVCARLGFECTESLQGLDESQWDEAKSIFYEEFESNQYMVKWIEKRCFHKFTDDEILSEDIVYGVLEMWEIVGVDEKATWPLRLLVLSLPNKRRMVYALREQGIIFKEQHYENALSDKGSFNVNTVEQVRAIFDSYKRILLDERSYVGSDVVSKPLGSKRARGNPHSDIICNYCGRLGHIDQACYKRLREMGNGPNSYNKSYNNLRAPQQNSFVDNSMNIFSIQHFNSIRPSETKNRNHQRLSNNPINNNNSFNNNPEYEGRRARASTYRY